MPEFQTWNSVSDIKPGASVLAQLQTSDGQSTPGLVVQRFGKGRAGALLVGDMWRWSLRRAQENTDDLAQSWRQIARWLTADVPRNFELDVQSPSNSIDPHRLVVTLRDAACKPLDNATVELTITQLTRKKFSWSRRPTVSDSEPTSPSSGHRPTVRTDAKQPQRARRRGLGQCRYRLDRAANAREVCTS